MYAAASALLLVLPWPGLLAAVLPLAYVASVARFARITDETCEDANRGWRTFLWLNQPVGFLVTMLLIVERQGLALARRRLHKSRRGASVGSTVFLRRR